MLLPDESKSIIQQLSDQLFTEKKVQVFIKREDLIHSEISGNKWRKLKYNLEAAKAQGHDTLCSFGGAFSNHIAALACAGKLFGFKTIGVIRGEEEYKTNPTLSLALQMGMRLHFVDRSTYRQKDDLQFLDQLRDQFGDFYHIPEGGSNCLAIKGASEIISDQMREFNTICCSCGTAGTITGIAVAAHYHQKVLGFPALKGDFMQKAVDTLTSECQVNINSKLEIVADYHFGGYAKYTEELIDFMNNFYVKHLVLLDPIYTGKLLFGIYDLIRKNRFPIDEKILVIHTGGLQGIKGFNQLHGPLLSDGQ